LGGGVVLLRGVFVVSLSPLIFGCLGNFLALGVVRKDKGAKKKKVLSA